MEDAVLVGDGWRWWRAERTMERAIMESLPGDGLCSVTMVKSVSDLSARDELPPHQRDLA